MDKENKKKKIIKNIKMAGLTGAAVVAIGISLVSCGITKNTQSETYNQQTKYTESFDNNYSSTNNIGSNYASRVDSNESHNYLLYASQNASLSTPIGADTFGLLWSTDNNNADRRLATGEYVGVDLDLSQDNYSEFAKWVDNQDVVYAYADLYDINKVLEELEQYSSAINAQNNAHTDLITTVDKKPSAELLTSVINKNTKEFLKKNSGYSELNSKYITMVSTIFSSIIEEYYDTLSKDDISRIYCMLNDLVVVNIDSMDFSVNDLKTVYNARVTEDGIIMLDVNQIENLKGNNTVERTIAHEIIHIFQRMCADHQIDGLTQIGNSQYIEKFDETGYANSLHFQWLYEASAERMSMDLYDANSPLVYKNMVGYLNTLDLITLIRPEYSSDAIEVSQLTTDPNKIYEVFGATTKEEKEEIAHMLYSICYLQTDREDFVTIYETKNGEIEGQETTIKRIMKESIVKTMTKYFYKNLAERVANSEVTMEDTFYLINVFESALNVHLIYDDADRYELNEQAIKFYVEVQNNFFTRVAESSNMTFDELIENFNNYALVIKTSEGYERNNSFSWLTEKEKDFIGQVLTTNINSLTINIRNLEQLQGTKTK